MKTIKELKISGKRVLMRVDFNVPLDNFQNITDDIRIRAALPTIHYILDRGARLIIASHIGRPGGNPDPKYSLAPVANRLGRLLKTTVRLAPNCIGPDTQKLVAQMKVGEVVLLENLRFHKAEQQNDDAFAEKLAAFCDVFINDAFAVSHRANASVEAIAKYVPAAGAGFLMLNELDYFQKVMEKPTRPMVAIIGGAKVSSKLKALQNMLQHVDKIISAGPWPTRLYKALVLMSADRRSKKIWSMSRVLS